MREDVVPKANDILRSMGLSKNEIRVYFDLMQYDLSSAFEVSKRTHIHRSNTYDSLRKLEEKGFVKEVLEDDLKLFKALDPQNLKTYIDEKGRELDTILPDLKDMSKKETTENFFTVGTGNFTAKLEIFDFFNSEEEILISGLTSEFFNSMGVGFVTKFVNMIKEKNVKLKVIYTDEDIENMIEGNNFEKKFFPDKNMQVTSFIGEEKLLLITSNEVIKIIKIKNKEITYSYKVFFGGLWRKI